MLLAAVFEARSAEFAANPAESDERLARRFPHTRPTGTRPVPACAALLGDCGDSLNFMYGHGKPAIMS